MPEIMPSARDATVNLGRRLRYVVVTRDGDGEDQNMKKGFRTGGGLC